MCGWVKPHPRKHPENGLFLQAVTSGASFVGDRKLHGVRGVARVGFGPIVLRNMNGQGRAFPCLCIAGGCKRAFAAADAKAVTSKDPVCADFETKTGEQKVTLHFAANNPPYAGDYSDTVMFNLAVFPQN